MIELGMIRDIVTIFGVIAGFSYYVLTVRNSQRMQKMTLETRQAQLFSFLMDKMDSVEWWTHYRTIRDGSELSLDEWQEKWREDPTIYGGLMSIVVFFNHMGWLVRKGLIDMETVRNTMSGQVVRIYENTKSGFEEYQRRTGRPQRYLYLEYLYENVKDQYYQDVQDIKT
jgi:hypothetical protein